MKNYAEELAYWYFRFNGFFLLNNHIVHRVGEQNYDGWNPNQAVAHSDNDLLGLRTKFVSEGVGYPLHACDDLLEIAPIDTNIIGLICEVKGGMHDLPLNNNLYSQIARLGLINNVAPIHEFLQNNSSFYDPETGIRIIKVLIRNRPDEEPNWNVISINHVIHFIQQRFIWFQGQKVGGWDKFDSILMQFMLKHPNHG